ncbi:unnamed protein product [Didymodactylos carnosus]|uniref:CBS domain-containing protein n=1 Tax=Didymodactylos carnosus TaxID=1234261 RepID=A0A814C2B7_9BILA|nr:unnamed protein product [Didymodactylos carnosus]CAF1038648.1 unnamed protein product [Didymodactylos carnosus]CAF3715056.1 unnamed protein product [Didymodactylos carnosus]CAF3806852.1 unnamed protein product [Didymodactylos carnosus]
MHSGARARRIDLETKLIDVLRIFQKLRISALPVVDKSKCLKDVYSKFDVMHLAATRTYTNLDVALEYALDAIHDKETRQLATCKKCEQLFEIMDKFVTREVHRLIVVDNDYRIVGVLSMSDLMKFLVTTFESLSRSNSTHSNSFSYLIGEPMDTQM